MAIYFSRSYQIVTVSTAFTHAELELSIYYGTKTTDRATGTVLNLKGKAVGGQVEFDIGPYIKDFIDPVFNVTLSSITQGACWADYRSRGYTPGGSTGAYSAYTSREYSLGYSKYGGVMTTTDELLISSDDGERFLKPAGEVVTVPLNRNSWVSEQFTGSGTQSPGYVGTTTDSDEIISYLTANNANYTAFGSLAIESVAYNTNHKVTPNKIVFMNRLGAYQELWFLGGMQESLNVTGEKFERAKRTSFGRHDEGNPNIVDYGKTGRLAVTLNSGWQPEANNNWFMQLMLSESIFFMGAAGIQPLSGYYSANKYPVRINQNSIVFKTRQRDRMINYTIQFEYAFDLILK